MMAPATSNHADTFTLDEAMMCRALILAARAQGSVEPNPMVGCVIARESQIVGEGWHQKFGGPHAEIEALRKAGPAARGATLYVTLEPCCHFGKTPPCADAVIESGIARVVAAMTDPFPRVAGGGFARLEAAGISITRGVLEDEATRLNAPYLKLLSRGRPWIIAKWAMTLDGKIATSTGESQWISNEASRRVVHALRGRMDAILVGRRTVERDDPLLTVRPPGRRTPLRIVIDSNASLPPTSRLVQTIDQAPLLVAASSNGEAARMQRLRDAGCEVLTLPGEDRQQRLQSLLDELGRRRLTNLLVEGGGELSGSLFDLGEIDEVHAFLAPKLIGGAGPSPLGGIGVSQMADAWRLDELSFESLDGDLHLWGRTSSRAVIE